MPITTAAYRMADRLAGGQLLSIVRDARADGRNFEDIARSLLADYGIQVTSKTLRSWIAQDDAERVA